MLLITLQGFPAANTPDGISLVTRLPAPITVLSPIVTPGRIVTFEVTHTLLPIVTGLAMTVPKSSKSCVDVMIMFRKEKEHPFPIVTGAQATINVSPKPTFSPNFNKGEEQ